MVDTKPHFDKNCIEFSTFTSTYTAEVAWLKQVDYSTIFNFYITYIIIFPILISSICELYYFVFYCCDKTPDKKQLGKKKGYLIYISQ